jgi:predicted acyl esterase
LRCSAFSRDKSKPNSTDESSDTYDTVDWLLKNVADNNGNAGMYGISYDGWTALIGATEPHPAMKAVSEQATPSDMFLGDDFHHNGAFRLSYGFEYAFMEEASKQIPFTSLAPMIPTTGISNLVRYPTSTKNIFITNYPAGTILQRILTTIAFGKNRR